MCVNIPLIHSGRQNYDSKKKENRILKEDLKNKKEHYGCICISFIHKIFAKESFYQLFLLQFLCFYLI